MKQNETNYGNFAEAIESQNSKRNESVVLCAIEKCEMLTKELNDSCVRIGELTREVEELKQYIKILKGE